MTIHGAGRDVLARGRSHAGETWEQALLRIYHASRPPDAPLCRVIFANRRANQSGGATNSVIVDYKDESGHGVSEALFIHTDPPQF